VRSHRFDAALDRVLDAPEKLLILGLKGQRRLASLATRGQRWVQRRLPRRRVLQSAAVRTGGDAGSDAGRGDRFVLYRIIGNDLYPRHDAGQSLANLRFVLEHEPALEGCEKRWLLNRIRQPEKLRELTALLDRHGCGYDVIPFDGDAFREVPWDWECLPQPFFLASKAYRRLLIHQRQSWEIALYRHKNNYLMNNNGARNKALELGRQRADWVLPWDGNCFVTAAGWRRLREAVLRQSAADYFHVPMQRVADNAHLLDPAFEADPRDEPQLVFAADAREQFNAAFPYGRRPKVELFWRLGLAGPWDAWLDEPWDQPRRAPLQPLPACPEAGWVARLHSGVRDPAAAAGTGVLDQGRRFSTRNLAIKASINQALLAGEGPGPALFSSFWAAGRPERLDAEARVAGELLSAWLRWWQGDAPAPAPRRQEQWVAALLHLVWQASIGAEAGAEHAALMEAVGRCWFAPGGQGLQPRLRLLNRPLRAGHLPGTEPTLAAVEQLALLSDLLAWRAGSWSWLADFVAWRDALAAQLGRMVQPAWLGQGHDDLIRLQLVQVVLQHPCAGPTDAVDVLLRLLSELQAPTAAHLDPVRRRLILALARQHGLLDSVLAERLGAGCIGEPLPPLLPVQAAAGQP
jgi:hypothetical protein